MMEEEVNLIKLYFKARHWELTPVILATWEAEIQRITGKRPAWANSS
jgi:hypothetical protein